MALLTANLFSKADNRPILKHIWIAESYNIENKPKMTQDEMLSHGVFVKGLVDTGSTRTCISKSIANKHNFRVLAQVPVTSASHESTNTNLYKVAVFIADNKVIGAKKMKDGKLIADTRTSIVSRPLMLPALEFAGDKSFDVIVGMDIISRGLLIVSGFEDRVTIAF